MQQHENLTLAINSAKAIGCVVIGIDSHSLNSGQGKKWLVLGLVWQLIKLYLFRQISINHVPGLVNIRSDGEEFEDIVKLSPEQLLLKWVNYHLKQVRCNYMHKSAFLLSSDLTGRIIQINQELLRRYQGQ